VAAWPELLATSFRETDISSMAVATELTAEVILSLVSATTCILEDICSTAAHRAQIGGHSSEALATVVAVRADLLDPGSHVLDMAEACSVAAGRRVGLLGHLFRAGRHGVGHRGELFRGTGQGVGVVADLRHV